MKKRRNSDFTDIIENETEFIRRDASNRSLYLLYGLVLAIAGFGAFVYKLEEVSIEVLVILFSVIILAGFALSIILIQQRNKRVVVSEFENLLFSSAASTGINFYIIYTQEWRVIYYSPTCNDYFSYQPIEKEGSFRMLMRHLNLEDTDWQSLMDDASSGKPTTISLELPDLSGVEHHMQLQLTALPRPRGYFVLKALAYDPSENEASHTEEEVSERVLESMPMAAYRINDAGILEYFNSHFANMLGYDHADLHHVTLASMLSENTLEQHHFTAAWNGTLIFKTKAGDALKAYVEHENIIYDVKRPPQLHGFVLPSASGHVPSGSGGMTLHESGALSIDQPFSADTLQRMWDTLVEFSPIPTMFIDEIGVIKQSNQALLDACNKDAKQTSGWSIYSILDGESADSVKKTIEALNKEDATAERSIDVKLSIDEDASAMLYLTTLEHSRPDDPSFVAYLVDTTEVKSLERRFVQSQKMQAVGQLAGGVAHDFNNLLTAMIGFCDLLLMRHQPTDPSFADIMQIKQNANRAANLVRQLLAFSRKQTLQPKVIDLTNELSELSHLIHRLIGESIELKLHHSRELWPIKFDQNQLEQVIINLAVNGRDAMLEKGGILAITTRNTTVEPGSTLTHGLVSASDRPLEPGDYVVIEISDTGCGMDRETMQKIFDPFFTTKGVGEGTGLGLSTVYGIIEQAGGKIYLTSIQDKGTTFSIFVRRHELEEGEQEAVAQIEEEARDLTGNETILLVEDEDPVRMFATRALEGKGYKVLAADCGEAGLRAIEEHGADNINVIITDVVMPGMNGPAMVKEIREANPDVVVIYISGYAEDTFGKSYGDDRNFHFLPKPFTLDQLAEKVKQVLSS